MTEFVFGTLSTLEKRVLQQQRLRTGVVHRSRLTPRAPRPGDAPQLTVLVGLPQAVSRVVCTVSEPETAVIDLQPGDIEWDLLNWQYVQTWQGTLPPQPEGTVVRYTIAAHPAHGGDPIPADDGAAFSYYVGDPAAPAWSREAIVYQIFPDRFYPGDGRSWNPVNSLNDIYGGTLRGVIDKLDYIAEMGFNCIWLNPFFPDDGEHHGYHAVDYFDVNPRLGSLDDVRELLQAAHTRGIRLLLDFVANHWSSRHESFVAAASDPDSPYRGWYNWIDYPDDYETFFGVMALPQINTEHPQVRDYLLRSIRFWLGEIGFDGLRLDFALGPSLDFWTDVRAAVKAVKPDAWIFGEVVETPTTLLDYEGRLDGCLDFPLAQSMRDLFALEQLDLATFDAFLTQHEQFFPDTYSRPSFLDNHDMNRFLWLAGDSREKLKLAALSQFTLAGPPIVYNGTEVGVHQNHGMQDPESEGMIESRQPMLWGADQDAELRDYFRWLAQLRREHPVLWRGARTTVHLDAAAQTVAYVRHDGQESVLVALNLSQELRQIEIDAPAFGVTHAFVLAAQSGDVHVVRA